jgi:uncharacterized membrane protein YccC
MNISVSRIICFIVGIILIIVGLTLVIDNIHDIWSLVIGAIFLATGIVLVNGRSLVL